jgi:hypothetical protein
MDCFAEPVIGRRFAPTRWLAMTWIARRATLSVVVRLDRTIQYSETSVMESKDGNTGSPAFARRVYFAGFRTMRPSRTS